MLVDTAHLSDEVREKLTAEWGGRARYETELPVVLSSIGSAETAAGEESCLSVGSRAAAI